MSGRHRTGLYAGGLCFAVGAALYLWPWVPAGEAGAKALHVIGGALLGAALGIAALLSPLLASEPPFDRWLLVALLALASWWTVLQLVLRSRHG